MDKIKFKGKTLKLMGEVNIKNKTLIFNAIDKEGKEKNITDFGNKMKVLSFIPKLNTSVCDNQTREIAKLANIYKQVSFITITMDDVKEIKKWCGANYLENLDIVSDRKLKEISKATNLLIKKINIFARGFVILDKNNKVINQLFNEEITNDPNFKELEKILKINSNL